MGALGAAQVLPVLVGSQYPQDHPRHPTMARCEAALLTLPCFSIGTIAPSPASFPTMPLTSASLSVFKVMLDHSTMTNAFSRSADSVPESEVYAARCDGMGGWVRKEHVRYCEGARRQG
jgi:hypothetical protein